MPRSRAGLSGGVAGLVGRSLTLLWVWWCNEKPRGALAQLGERFHGMEEVRGSNPLCSTKISLSVLVSYTGHMGDTFFAHR